MMRISRTRLNIELYLILNEKIPSNPKKIPSDCKIARYLLDDYSANSFHMAAKRQENASCEYFISYNSLAAVG